MAKNIFMIFLGLLTLGLLIQLGDNYFNKLKHDNFPPPYILENKIQNKDKENYFILRPVNEDYNNAFKWEVGNFTYNSYQLGDTINNI